MDGGQREGCRIVVRTRGNQRGSGGIGESFDGFSVIDGALPHPAAAWEGSIPGAVL